MNNFLILHRTGFLYRYIHNIPIFEPKSKKFASRCLNSMSLVVCHHIRYLGFVKGNKDVFLSDDQIGDVSI